MSTLTADLRDSVAFGIGHSVPEVQAVFTRLDNKILHVWMIVPERDPEVYGRIYSKEEQLIDEFDAIDFAFNIINGRGRDPRTLLSETDADLVFLR